MSGVSTTYELSGRTRQKARTREAIVASARELLAEGVSPTVEQAADRAGVSRTTAYRYFRNRRELMLGCYPELEAGSLLGPDPPADPVARLGAVLDRLKAVILGNEPELRAALRLSLESPAAENDELHLRRGRAIGWIEDALAPLQDGSTADEIRRLATAIRAAYGIEPLVWLTDIAGLPREEAEAMMRSTALTLLREALRSR